MSPAMATHNQRVSDAAATLMRCAFHADLTHISQRCHA